LGKNCRSFLLFALLAAIALCPSLCGQQQQAPLGRIIGSVRVVKGDFPPTPVLVTLELRGGAMGNVYTDGQGRFGFYALAANQYRVTIDDEAYQPVSQDVSVYPDVEPMNFVQFDLVPRENKKKPDPQQGQVPGSNPYLIDPNQYLRRYPKKTIKEFEKGVEAEKHGDLEVAIVHYEKAIANSPDFYPAHNNLGSAFLSQRKIGDAQSQFEAAISANQNDAQARFNLANVLLLTQRYNDAAVELQEGFKRQPVSAFGQFLRGSLYSHTDQPELAEKSLLTALNLEPTMSQAYLQLVNLYLQQKRTSDAVGELQTYLKEFPEAQFSQKARDLLKRLQANASSNP
jgi:tetratricopeptide (TPR) repeat protein